MCDLPLESERMCPVDVSDVPFGAVCRLRRLKMLGAKNMDSSSAVELKGFS